MRRIKSPRFVTQGLRNTIATDSSNRSQLRFPFSLSDPWERWQMEFRSIPKYV